jgi:signal transduction histidine kinase
MHFVVEPTFIIRMPMSEVDRAIALLKSEVSHDRLKGARTLARHQSQEILQALKKCLRLERVAFVQTALKSAIKRQSLVVAEHEEEDEADSLIGDVSGSPEIKRQIFAKATGQVSGMLLHELEPKIGMLKVAAAQEVPNFESSSVKKYLNSLERSFTGISDLREATASPRATEFDLAQMVEDIIVEESHGPTDIFNYHGPQPFVIISDANLLTLAISNGIRNGLEAVTMHRDAELRNVIVDWGETDVDYWLTILDSGPGINGAADAAFDIGNTNKPGHGGFGLAVVRGAMENLGGGAIIEPGRNSGALLQLRWGKLYEREDEGSGR